VILSYEEIIQACTEWAEKHHGLTEDGIAEMRVTLGGEAVSRVKTANVEFSVKARRAYRDPGAT